jgi:hypothetical protein
MLIFGFLDLFFEEYTGENDRDEHQKKEACNNNVRNESSSGGEGFLFRQLASLYVRCIGMESDNEDVIVPSPSHVLEAVLDIATGRY